MRKHGGEEGKGLVTCSAPILYRESLTLDHPDYSVFALVHL
jgi:hypothetical protein